MTAVTQGWINFERIPVFGSSIYQLYREQRDANKSEAVPVWLLDLCQRINKEIGGDACTLYANISIEPKNIDLYDSIYTSLCQGLCIQWQDYSLDCAILFLRLAMEKLPEPLLTFDLHDQFIGAIRTFLNDLSNYSEDIWESLEHQLEFLCTLVYSLPVTHSQLLKHIICIFTLAPVSERQAIAQVWGPTLLLRKGMHPFNASKSDASRLIVFMTEHFLKCPNTVTPSSPRVDTLSQTPSRRRHKPKTPSDVVKSTTNFRRTPPSWLKELNLKKKQTRGSCSQLVRSKSSFTSKDFHAQHQLSLGEFLHNFSLLDDRLNLIESELNPETANHLVDTFHLSRSYRYICDLDETLHCTQEIAASEGSGDARLILYFTNDRLKESLERLRLALHYECNLFFDYIEDFFGIKPADNLIRTHTIDLISHSGCQSLWAEHFGIETYLVGWSFFYEIYLENAKLPPAEGSHLPPNAEERLRAVLDPSCTGYRFAFFFEAFKKQNLRFNLHTALYTVSQPYFHPSIARGAIKSLFEPHQVGTFLVRFSSTSPGSFAFDYKKQDGLYATKIFTIEDGSYLIVESHDVTRTFDSIPQVVDYYNSLGLLLFPLNARLYESPYFYGFLSLEETDWYLQGEQEGTFLIRFSLTFADQLTISYVGSEGLNSLRLERLADYSVSFMDQTYTSLDEALATYNNLFVRPYRDIVSMQEEEEIELRRTNGKLDSPNELFYLPANSFEQFPELLDDFEAQLTKYGQYCSSLPSSCKSLPTDRMRQLLHSACFRQDEKSWTNIQKSVHSALAKEAGIKRLKLSHLSFRRDGIELNKVTIFSLTLTNDSRSKVVKYSVIDPVTINRRCFVSVVNPKGTVDKSGTKSNQVKVDVVVVLYKPLSYERILTLKWKYIDSETHTYYHIPIRIGSKSLFLTTPESATDPYWVIHEDEFHVGESISGSSSNVNSASLYGAKVAVKRWDYKQKQPLPESFVHELQILRELQHDNLVMFVGARADKPGVCFIVTEYCVNNSLFNYLPNHKLTLQERVEIALDAATGMQYMHSHNLVHRDLKSLNLLVDGEGHVKVADFGETRVVSHLMTPERGSYNWMAPEVLKTRTYTGKADIFSFGIILWEICTAQRPDRLMSDILAGVTFIFPKVWDKTLHEVVILAKLCWQLNPAKRPSFTFIIKKLHDCRDRLLKAPIERRSTSRSTKLDGSASPRKSPKRTKKTNKVSQ